MPYIGNTIRAADDYRLIDDISSSFNGSTTSFALQVAGSAPVPFPKSPQQVLISVNGVIQEPDPTGASGFNLVGTNIVFSSAPTNGHAFFGIIYATADYLNAGGNFPAGALGSPSITFIADENTGLYRKSSGSVGFVSDATEIANFDSNGITISSGNIIIPDSIIHNGDSDTKIRFPSADTVSVETGGTERIGLSNSGVVVNESGASVDFRVEGDTETNLFLVDASTDRIGIRTNTPSDIFEVTHADNAAAGISITNTNNSQASAMAQLLISGGDNSKGRLKLETSGAFHTIDEDSNGNLIIEDNGTEKLRLDSSGRLGLGDDSPDREFVVKNASSNSSIKIEAANDSTSQLFFSDTDAENVARIAVFHGSGSDQNTLNLETAGSSRLAITSTGLVGIGTLVPDHQLSAIAANSATPRIGITNPDNDENINISTYHDSNGIYAYIGANAKLDASGNLAVDTTAHKSSGIHIDGRNSGSLQFHTGGTGGIPVERMRISDGGKFGLGVSSVGSAFIEARENSPVAGRLLALGTNGTATNTTAGGLSNALVLFRIRKEVLPNQTTDLVSGYGGSLVLITMVNNGGDDVQQTRVRTHAWSQSSSLFFNTYGVNQPTVTFSVVSGILKVNHNHSGNIFFNCAGFIITGPQSG